MHGYNDQENPSFYNPFDAMSFNHDSCFLCGSPLEDNSSDEHIFPKWLLNKFALWDQTTFLLNKTTIPYRKLTIPCCFTCNNNHLSKVENIIQYGLKDGYQSFIKIPELTIYQWIAKISYGLVFKELSLFTDRKDQEKGTITASETLLMYRDIHCFLQSVRAPFNFINKPWSMIRLNMIDYGSEVDFDYYDGIITGTFAIRMNDIGIIVCLHDNGSQEEAMQDLSHKLKEIKLHPIQFDEIVAKVAYTASLLNRTPKYCIVSSAGANIDNLVLSLPLQGYSSKLIFDDWIQKDYANLLSFFWKKYGMDFHDIFKEPNLVLSMIYTDNGSINILNPDGTQKR